MGIKPVAYIPFQLEKSTAFLFGRRIVTLEIASPVSRHSTAYQL
jgi:hypothetical protein